MTPSRPRPLPAPAWLSDAILEPWEPPLRPWPTPRVVWSLRDEMVAWLPVWEDRRRWAYDDPAGNRAVGIGCNLDVGEAVEDLRAIGADYAAVRAGRRPLTERQIDALFGLDLDRAIASAERLTPGLERHPRAIQRLVVDLVYTAGATGYSRLRTLRTALARFDYARVATALRQTRWFRQVGARAREHLAAIQALGTTFAVQ